jgi:hypothetical protein
VHVVNGHQANFAQLFIGVEGFFLIAGTLDVPETRFARNSGQLILRDSQQNGRSALRYIFRNWAVHAQSPLCGNRGHGVFFHCQDHRFVNVYIPTIADANAESVATLFEELAAERNLDVA